MRKQHLFYSALTLTLILAGVAGAQEEAPTAEPQEAPAAAVPAPEPSAPEPSAPEPQEAPVQEEGEQLVLSDPDTEKTLVMTGRAVNASPEEIIIETDDGREVFLVDTESLYPEPIAEGQRVTVWFVERADRYYATELKLGDHLNPSTLPQTASHQPLLALAGLLAFAGALGLWRLRLALES